MKKYIFILAVLFASCDDTKSNGTVMRDSQRKLLIVSFEVGYIEGRKNTLSALSEKEFQLQHYKDSIDYINIIDN